MTGLDESAPVAAIPRVERQESHYRFLWAVRPPTVMINLDHAARVLMHRGEEFFPPETSVIVTSTISDATLAGYSFEDELRIYRALEPEYVIPFDFPVYSDMPADRRVEHALQIAVGSIDMHRILSEDLSQDTVEEIARVKGLPEELIAPVQDTTVLPLVKGATREERAITFEAVKRTDAPVQVVYGVQHLTVGSNGSFPALCDDLELVSEETGGFPTLVIGLLSPTGLFSLEDVPANVVGGAGVNQWVKRAQPASSSPEEMQCAFRELFDAAADAVGVDASYSVPGCARESPFPPCEFRSLSGYAVAEDFTPSVAGAAGDGAYGFGGRKRPEYALDAVTAGRLGGLRAGANPGE